MGLSLNQSTTLSAIQLFVAIVSPHLFAELQVLGILFCFTLQPSYFFLLVDAKNSHSQPLFAFLHLALNLQLSFFTVS
uniref:Uncharacterized protein n=1 Tax=Arundo donax TaxID=35708 RepID=A0A0A8ZL65_ARUDO